MNNEGTPTPSQSETGEQYALHDGLNVVPFPDLVDSNGTPLTKDQVGAELNRFADWINGQGAQLVASHTEEFLDPGDGGYTVAASVGRSTWAFIHKAPAPRTIGRQM